MLFWKILFFVEYSFSIRLPVSDKTVSIEKKTIKMTNEK